MGDRLAFVLGYGALFVVTALWIVHQFLPRDQDKGILAARGGSVLATVSLGLGLVLRGFRVGYWPFHTAYELSTVGLLGLVLASFLSLLPHRNGILSLTLSVLSSLLALYGLLSGTAADSATLVLDSGWWAAYVVLCGFGGGLLTVAGVAGAVAHNSKGKEWVGERALAWSLLALSAGLASGAWWFERLSGHYWGDARWGATVAVWLLTMAAWHGR